MSFWIRDTVNICIALFLFFVYGYLEVTSKGGVFIVIALGCFFIFLHQNHTINLISLLAMLVHFYGKLVDHRVVMTLSFLLLDCLFLFADMPVVEEFDEIRIDNKVKGGAKPSSTIRIPNKSPSTRPSREVTPLPTIQEQHREESWSSEDTKKIGETKVQAPSSPVIRLSKAQKKQNRSVIEEAIRQAREAEQQRLEDSVQRLQAGKQIAI